MRSVVAYHAAGKLVLMDYAHACDLCCTTHLSITSGCHCFGTEKHSSCVIFNGTNPRLLISHFENVCLECSKDWNGGDFCLCSSCVAISKTEFTNQDSFICYGTEMFYCTAFNSITGIRKPIDKAKGVCSKCNSSWYKLYEYMRKQSKTHGKLLVPPKRY